MARKLIKKHLDVEISDLVKGSDSHETRVELLLLQIVLELKKLNKGK